VHVGRVGAGRELGLFRQPECDSGGDCLRDILRTAQVAQLRDQLEQDVGIDQ